MKSWNNYFLPEFHKGMYASSYGLMTSKVEDPLLDHFFHILLDNIIIYGGECKDASTY
jgi:hypothetical protein